MPEYKYQSYLNDSAETVFRWHTRPGALQRLMPPWHHIRKLEKKGSIRDGDEISFHLQRGPLDIRWRAIHKNYREGVSFTDEQVEGVFQKWIHTHAFYDNGPEQCLAEDHVEYELPFPPVGGLLLDWMVQREHQRVFRFRHERLKNDLARHRRFADRPRLRIAITGASGFIGTQLRFFLQTGGHEVYALVRRTPEPEQNEIYWNPDLREIDAPALENFDAVIHLAGERLSRLRWTDEFKKRVFHSRVDGTAFLCETLAALENPPKTLISSSATGYYGDTGIHCVDESAPSGEGFLAHVCRHWEAATQPAQDAGVRVVHLRIGVVMGAAGGMLKTVRLPFQFCLGGKLGSGRQHLSWISLDDLLGAIYYVMYRHDISGAVNAVSPIPVSHEEFTQTLADLLNRPAFLSVPETAARYLMGDMADELLFTSQCVLPRKLEHSDFVFYHKTIHDALRFELGV
jgi:uncharacterized protein (TIGR01777 family)